MRRVAFNDAGFDGVGKDAAEKTNGPRSRSSATSDDGLSAQLLGLDRNPRLSGHDVLEDLVDVGLGEVLEPSELATLLRMRRPSPPRERKASHPPIGLNPGHATPDSCDWSNRRFPSLAA